MGEAPPASRPRSFRGADADVPRRPSRGRHHSLPVSRNDQQVSLFQRAPVVVPPQVGAGLLVLPITQGTAPLGEAVRAEVADPAKQALQPLGKYWVRAQQAPPMQAPPGYVKTGGNILNPFNWPVMLWHLVTGRPQLSTDMRRVDDDGEAGGTGFVIDGFDDVANAVSGSGLSKQLAAILQAGVFYPLVLPLVNVGAEGARAELGEAREEYQDGVEKLQGTRKALLAHSEVQGLENFAQLSRMRSPDKLIAALLRQLQQQHAEYGRSFDGALCQLMVAYRLAADQHQANKLALGASPGSLIGTHGMLAGVALYEGAAIANMVGSTAAQSAAVLMSTVGNFVMGVGQVAMAIYGVVGVVRAAKVHQVLQRHAQWLQAAQISDPVKQDLLAENRAQRRLNGIIGGANGGLAIGQVLMLLGGAVFCLGLPLLVVGAVLTVGSIITRIVAQGAYERRFGVGDDDVAEQASLGEPEQAHQLAAQEVEWAVIVAATERFKRQHAGTLHSEKTQQALMRKLNSLYRASDPRAQIVSQLLEEKKLELTDFMQCQAPDAATYMHLAGPAANLNEYLEVAPEQRLATLMKLAKEQIPGDELQREIIKQLVLAPGDFNNLRGHSYDAYLTRTKVWTKASGFWRRQKTVYSFDQQGFLTALEHRPQDASAVPLAEVEQIVQRALQKTIAGVGLRQKRQVRAATYNMLVAQAGAEAMGRQLTTS